jgi:hypothetical protein
MIKPHHSNTSDLRGYAIGPQTVAKCATEQGTESTHVQKIKKWTKNKIISWLGIIIQKIILKNK